MFANKNLTFENSYQNTQNILNNLDTKTNESKPKFKVSTLTFSCLLEKDKLKLLPLSENLVPFWGSPWH